VVFFAVAMVDITSLPVMCRYLSNGTSTQAAPTLSCARLSSRSVGIYRSLSSSPFGRAAPTQLHPLVEPQLRHL
jgi:hypothetical protein